MEVAMVDSPLPGQHPLPQCTPQLTTSSSTLEEW